ncbi:MAG: YncE family protein [bacterium]
MTAGIGKTAAAGAVLLVAFILALPYATHSQEGRYEVWTIDQADAARGGARLYIYDGQRLEAGQAVQPEVVNLDAAAAGVGDGAGVRPHMLELTHDGRHAIIANVASGHVYVMRAQERRIIASIDIGEQVHHAMATRDGAYIIAANQNGKRLARIRADFAAERFTYNRADDLNLAALEDAAHPDNAPICPVLSGRLAFVTVRGGGLYVVDYQATPMRVMRAYGRDQIGPAGCGGAIVGDKLYINSGTATSSNLYVFDAATAALQKSINVGWTGWDAHGTLIVGAPDRPFLWMANRADGNVAIINVNRDSVVGIFDGVGAGPDLMGLSPSGRRVYLVLRGPNNLTGGPSAKGQTPGLAILEVLDGGQRGRRVGFVAIGDQTAASPNDPHTVAVRPLR